MTLAKWLRDSGLSNRELGERIAVSEEAARLYRAGQRRPGPDTVARIVALTGGAVTADDLNAAYTRLHPNAKRKSFQCQAGRHL